MGLLHRIDSAAVPAKPATLQSPSTPGPVTAPSEPMARRAVPGQAIDPSRAVSRELKNRVQAKVIAELDPKSDLSDESQMRHSIQLLFDQTLEQEGIVMTRGERQKLFEEVHAEIQGFGPIEPLLQDPSVSEIMVNGPKLVYVERQGKLIKTGVEFENDEHVMRIIDRIVSPLGRHIDESSPMVDARLPDGSRVNAIIPPLSLVGPTITIRKFAKIPLTVDDLIRF